VKKKKINGEAYGIGLNKETIYRVGQKSKLLIVNKTEKIGGM